MPLTVATARVTYRGPDRLQITRWYNRDQLGMLFAPSTPLLRWGLAERKAGRTCWEGVYRERYLAEMESSREKYLDAWSTLLGRERVVLCCFCPAGQFCHRVVLAEYLVTLGAVYTGEVLITPKGNRK